MSNEIVPNFLSNVRSYVSSYDMINALRFGLKRDFEQKIISKEEFEEINKIFFEEKERIKKQFKLKNKKGGGLIALL